MLASSDFKDLLRIFNAKNVKYLIVGGYAVVKYCEPRYTKDLGLWISTARDNAEPVFAALREFGAPLHDLSAEDFAAEGHFYQIGLPPLRVDVLMCVTGVAF